MDLDCGAEPCTVDLDLVTELWLVDLALGAVLWLVDLDPGAEPWTVDLELAAEPCTVDDLEPDTEPWTVDLDPGAKLWTVALDPGAETVLPERGLKVGSFGLKYFVSDCDTAISVCNWARSLSEKERSRFRGTGELSALLISPSGESSSSEIFISSISASVGAFSRTL